MKQSNSIRIIIWIFIILFLLAGIFFILEYFNIWSVSSYYTKWFGTDKAPTAKVEDPLLLEKEELMKAKMSLDQRAKIIEARDINLKKMQKEYDQLILTLKTKKDQIAKQMESIEQSKQEEESRDKKIKYLSDKLSNMPPEQAVRIIEGLDTLLVIEIFKQMDKDAAEAGRQSIVNYLLSLIAAPSGENAGEMPGGRNNPKKAQEILKYISKFPDELIRKDDNKQ